jgi:hypothetical protein
MWVGVHLWGQVCIYKGRFSNQIHALICRIFKAGTLLKVTVFWGVAQWLRRCATSRTVPGSILGGVTEFFSNIFPSERTMALGSTQPLVKMSTRNISGGKSGRCVRLITSPPSCAECHEIWEPKFPGTLWATPDLLRGSFNFLLYSETEPVQTGRVSPALQRNLIRLLLG